MKYLAGFLSFAFGLVAFIFTLGCFMLFYGMTDSMKIPIVVEGTIEYSEIEWQLIGQDLGSIFIAVLCIILFAYFYSLYRKLGKKKKDTLNKDNIKGPFVLYLRSFKDDAATRKKTSFTDVRSEEEVLVEVLTDIAPVYAIGDPRDKKMPLGASRIYVDDEHWKSTVMEMAQKASVVVLRLGKTDSFWWEVEMTFKSVPIEKILFVIPESKTFSNVATLYKILLENNRDISQLDIHIEKKLSGSISSVLYFDNDGNAKTEDVRIARFTRLFISYENVLRNTLADFRVKFGLSTKRKQSIRVARILQVLLIVYISFMGFSKYFYDYVSLKYQMPYELVEECIQDSAFVAKYSDDINGTNLTWSIVEAKKGAFALSDEDYLFLFMIEAKTISSVSYDEYEQINKSPKNLLLMVKKYAAEDYTRYISVLTEAAITAIYAPNDIKDLIQLYQSSMEILPQWIIDISNSEDNSISKHEYFLAFNNSVIQHINDKRISDVLKVLSSQNIKIGD